MNVELQSTQVEGTSGLGPGKLLRTARLEKNLGIDKIATQLHLSQAMVEAIERDDYDLMPRSVFVQGYLRNYARLLSLPVDSIMRAYTESMPESDTPPPLSTSKMVTREVGSGHLLVRLVTWLIVILLVGFVLLWWRGKFDWPWPESARVVDTPITEGADPVTDHDEERPYWEWPAAEPEPEMLVAPAEVVEQTLAKEPVSAPLAPAVEDRVSPGVAVQPTLDAEPAPPEVVSPALQGSSSEAPAVVFEFSGTSWVDIRDATGEHRITGTMRAGTTRAAKGEPPFSVVLGNTAAVKVTVDGKPFDFSRFSQGNVARFTLDPDAEARD